MMVLKVVQEIISRHPSLTGARLEPVPGLDAGRIAKLTTGNVSGFVKWGTDSIGRALSAEHAGLITLRTALHPLKIPSVIQFFPGDRSTPTILILEWLDRHRPSHEYSERLGHGLAALHRNTLIDGYGSESDNFIGQTEQKNGIFSSWTTFFRDSRLKPMQEYIQNKGYWRNSWSAPFDSLLDHLAEYIPAKPTSSKHRHHR